MSYDPDNLPIRKPVPGPYGDLHPVQIEIYRNMTPTEKLDVAMRLRESAFQLKEAWLRQQHPDWTPEQVREETKRIFMHARS